MFISWMLENFKSVSTAKTIEFGPLTIFAGANSSGKSTIIQSMLLVMQTVRSDIQSRRIVLNGNITRLGTFKDVLFNDAVEQSINVGFELCPQTSEESTYAHRSMWISPTFLKSVESIKCQFSFSVANAEKSEVAQLQPLLDESLLEIKMRPGDQQVGANSIHVFRRDKAESTASALNVDPSQLARIDPSMLSYRVGSQLSYIPDYFIEGVKSAEVIGVYLNHFLPKYLAFAYDGMEAQIHQIFQLFDLTSYRRRELDATIFDLLKQNDRAFTIVLERLKSITPTDDIRAISALEEFVLKRDFASFKGYLATASNNLLHLKLTSKGELLDPSAKVEIEHALRAQYQVERSVQPAGPPDQIAYGSNYVEGYFSDQVKYLGPLRDEPKPIYPHWAATDLSDVGFKGEFTAAVLDLHKDKLITYISSAAFSEKQNYAEPITASLEEAVLDWLNFMGVANRVQTKDQGKLGHEFKVATLGSTALHDLTHVGVGVSQILPILVQSLLIDSGATLVFEQPELHLHPKVQSRLADFFLSLALIKKQCVVETHSEYLIKRLRYLSATADGATLSSLTKMYFVEKHEDGSHYMPVHMNQYGAMINWPEGFFDESDILAAETVRAAMHKKRINKTSKQ